MAQRTGRRAPRLVASAAARRVAGARQYRANRSGTGGVANLRHARRSVRQFSVATHDGCAAWTSGVARTTRPAAANGLAQRGRGPFATGEVALNGESLVAKGPRPLLRCAAGAVANNSCPTLAHDLLWCNHSRALGRVEMLDDGRLNNGVLAMSK